MYTARWSRSVFHELVERKQRTNWKAPYVLQHDGGRAPASHTHYRPLNAPELRISDRPSQRFLLSRYPQMAALFGPGLSVSVSAGLTERTSFGVQSQSSHIGGQPFGPSVRFYDHYRDPDVPCLQILAVV